MVAVACVIVGVVAGVFWTGAAPGAGAEARPGTPGAPYANMPALASIGVRVDKYVDIPDFAKGPPVDPARGYRTQRLGEGLYMWRSSYFMHRNTPRRSTAITRSNTDASSWAFGCGA